MKSEPDKATAESEGEEKSSKVKLVLYVVAGIAGLCLLLWLLIGRIECFFSDADNDSLKGQMVSKEKELKNLTNVAADYVQRINYRLTELEALRNRNAQLQRAIMDMDAQITTIQAIIIEKTKENEAIKVTVKQNAAKIEEMKIKLVVQQDEIDELQADIDDFFDQLHLIWDITSKQLDRNHALEREIDFLDETASALGKQMGALGWEVLSLKEKLGDEKIRNAKQWLSLKLIESEKKATVKITHIYNGTNDSCDSQQFYNKIKDLKKPNLFLASEASSGLVFGGYTAQSWETNEGNFKNDESAFTFSATYESVCKPNDPAHAIYTARKNETADLLLTFGNFDISLADKCIKESKHRINPRANYRCDKEGTPNIYTQSTHPTLAAFSFYQVEVLTP